MLIQSARSVFCLAVALVTMTGYGVAAPINPTFDTFGSLPAATFGGSGIPNDAVAISSFTDGGNTITIGLTATERFSEPPVGNDGAGTFSALAGGFPGDPSLARWNFGFFIEILGGGALTDYAISLLYDLDPGAGTDEADHGVIDFMAVAAAGTPGLALIEGSENLGFGYLKAGIPPFVTPPTFPGTFDPSATGEYTFALRVSSLAGAPLGETAIAVNTVPEPTSMALFGLTALGMGGVIRRRRKQGQTAEAVNIA